MVVMETGILSKRIFIGGLSESVSESELLERFSRFGKVSNVSLKTRVDDKGAPLKSFAHLNLQGDEASIKKCFSTYQNAKWKGSVMKLQYAKESVLERLQKEREESDCADVTVPKPEPEKSPSTEILSTAKGVPGTPVPGKKDWVVGKYGRALPVLKLKKSYKIPMVKLDPSKYCHAAKVFKDEGQDTALESSCSKLTWEINKPDSDITKKRKGEFPENSLPPKKKPAIDGLNNTAPMERDKVLSFSRTLNRKQNALSSVHREKDDLEVVKIGAVIKRSGSASFGNTSNKFDSDIDSESESGPSAVVSQPNQRKSKTVSPGKPRTFDRASDNGQNHNRLIGPNDGGKRVSKSLPDKQNEEDDSFSYNRVGIPEFKGLSMLTGLAESSAASVKSDIRNSNRLSATKQAQVPSFTDSKEKAERASLSNGYVVNTNPALSLSSLASTVTGSVDTHAMSCRESSIVANPIQDVTIATPAPFSTSRECTGFKTSTPNAPTDLSKQGRAQVEDNEPQPFRLIPEFKGLGMLADYSVDDKKKDVRLNSQRSESGSVLSTNLSPSSNIKSKQGQKEVSLKQNAKASKFPSDMSLKPTQKDNSKRLKFTAEHRDQEGNCDSDSSAGTDEIILRHKEQKSSGTAVLSKSERLVKQCEPSNKSPKWNTSVDSNLYMSEFVSGVDEFGEAQCPKVSSSYRNSDNDSYDSDLDSNNFALVAKKLRQQAFLSKQGVTGKMNSGDKKRKDFISQKEEAMPLTRDTKGVDRQGMTDLQSKLINIADLKMESATSSKAVDRENMKQEKQGHLSEKEKHRVANEKRLEAVKQQAKQRQQQQQLMQQALRNVDSLETNKKRIVFDSSDDDSGDEDEKVKGKLGDVVSPAAGKNFIAEEGQKQQETPGPALFASSDDEESDEDDYDEMFKSKPQFEGKKGEKLLKLENRFGDKRFKMDAKFADTDSAEDEEEDSNDKDEAVGSINTADLDLSTRLKEEKSSSLKVLEGVVGKSTLDRFSEKISRNTKKIIDMNSVRFDPTKMSVSPVSVPASEKKETVASSAARSKLHQSEALNSTNLKKKEKNTTKTEVGKVDGVVKPSKVDSDEHHNNNQAEEEDKDDHHVRKKEKESLSKKDEPGPDSKSKTNVELSSSLLNLFKAKAEQKENKDALFSLSQQFGDADSDDNEEEKEKGDRLKGNEVVTFGKNRSAINRLELAAEKDEGVIGVGKGDESPDNEEEKDHVGTSKVPSFSESDLSSDEEEKEVENVKTPSSSSGDKSQNGIGEDLQDAGRIDVRFTKDKWHEQWDALRQNIIKIYKKKHKDALKKKRIHGETKRKKEFLKNSKRAGKKNLGAFKKR